MLLGNFYFKLLFRLLNISDELLCELNLYCKLPIMVHAINLIVDILLKNINPFTFISCNKYYTG